MEAYPIGSRQLEHPSGETLPLNRFIQPSGLKGGLCRVALMHKTLTPLGRPVSTSWFPLTRSASEKRMAQLRPTVHSELPISVLGWLSSLYGDRIRGLMHSRRTEIWWEKIRGWMYPKRRSIANPQGRYPDIRWDWRDIADAMSTDKLRTRISGTARERE